MPYYSRPLSSLKETERSVSVFAEFEHNSNGLLTSINRYELDENALLTSIAESLYTYNANNAVTSITHKNPDETQIVQHSYTCDSTNNIVEYLNSIDGNTEYNYDYLGQLISADYANQTDESYIYDSNGNRITANGSNYTTGDNNELTSDGTWSYTYDSEGNRISKTNAANTERELYTWDYRNRLTTVTKQTYDTLTNEWTTVQIVEYAYDYNNIWIRKTLDTNGDGIADSKTIFIPENYQTTVQLDDTDLTDATGPVVTHHYLWTPNQQDKLLADTTTSGILWALTDHLGTIRDVLDGNSSTHLIYDAFGNLTSGTNPLLFGFTGKAFDNDTYLQNNINRWYDATIGRWLSTDPIGFEGRDTNLYRYVGNNIIIVLDYSGLLYQNPVPEGASNCSATLYYIDLNPIPGDEIAKRHSCIQVEWYEIDYTPDLLCLIEKNGDKKILSHPLLRLKKQIMSFELTMLPIRPGLIIPLPQSPDNETILGKGPWWGNPYKDQWKIVARKGPCKNAKPANGLEISQDPSRQKDPCSFIRDIIDSAYRVGSASNGKTYCLATGHTCNSVTSEIINSAGGIFPGDVNQYPGAKNSFSWR